MLIRPGLLLAFCLFFFASHAQSLRSDPLHRTLHWTDPVEIRHSDADRTTLLSFEGARYDATTGLLPFFSENIRKYLNSYVSEVSCSIANPVFEPLAEARLIRNRDLVGADINVRTDLGKAAGEAVATVSFIPIRRTGAGTYEKLVAFDLVIRQKNEARGGAAARTAGVSNSVLSTGTWYKLAVRNEGVYRIDYAMLKSMGIDPDAIQPQQIRMYGNGGGMLPEANAAPRTDDLQEIAIVVSGESDGVFDPQDFILFYGQSPDTWTLDTANGRYHHTRHLYSDETYYFLTTDGPGLSKRITQHPSLPPDASDLQVTTVDAYGFHEADLSNFIKSGRTFFGEAFDLNVVQSYSFSVPNLDATPVYYNLSVMAHSNAPSGFTLVQGGQQLCSLSIPAVGTNYLDPYGAAASCDGTFPASGNGLQFVITYFPSLPSSVGYLDFIEFNARRSLAVSGNFTRFRDKNTLGSGVHAAYTVQGLSTGLTLWDITDHADVFEQATAAGTFVATTNRLREYLVFGNAAVTAPVFRERIDNQNLHALASAEFLIVSHPLFLAEANRLADFHRTHDNMTVAVADVDQVYNEFSGGARDVSAIRDFVRMFYEKYPSDPPRYLLLFGDGSYINKNDYSGNTNFIPTYQSVNSLAVLESYVSDDFFGLLDSTEGYWPPNAVQYLDVGVGRMPVKTAAEARQMVDKVVRYYETGNLATPTACTEANSSLGDWRNILCLIADDEDGGTHLTQTENLLNGVNPYIFRFNVDKIYLDAFPQESTPGGQLYPDVNQAIDNRVQKGALVINYTGHGGELGWAHEKILGNEMINAWTNGHRMPLFITATCEFSRFDDPARTSSGEFVLLNSGGGGIALFSTTRLVYSSPNAILNHDIFEHMFDPQNSVMPRLGDIFRLSKVDNAAGINPRNFTLLGDPAVRLAYPKYDIVATAIDNQPLAGTADTIRALSRVTLSGEVRQNGQKLTGFNGVIYPTVYDKPVLAKTLGQDQGSPVLTFSLQKNIIYKGKASVTQGDFSFTFIVPKDIAYHFGPGRLSFYAQDGTDDASGYYDSLIIGGFTENAVTDAVGPDIRLYLNDEKFVFGGTTNENPALLAIVSDSSGINTVGNGIGHDISARLDGQTSRPHILNDYYEADLDEFQKGRILYHFKDLSDGRHTLDLKVWDIFNNSSEAYTEFVVASSAEIALAHVLNYPNPFTTHTSFFFEHNQACDGLDVQVQIYTVSGKRIATINKRVFCNGYRTDEISWDGTDDFGDRIGRGVYVYQLKVRNARGQTAEKFEKLVLLR